MTADALPRLRDDLRLHPGPCSLHGEPTWTIHDPVRNLYIRIGSLAFHVLSAWHLGSLEAISRDVCARTGRAPRPEELQWLTRFLQTHSLLTATTPQDVRRLAEEDAARNASWRKRLAAAFFFFRVPLVHPDAMLRRLLPLVEPLYTRTALACVACLGLVGVMLALRQWDAFGATFLHFYSWEGAMLYAMALVFAKVIHELGHATTAARHGLRIPSMGLIFIVFWPVLYTDTGDAWKLTARRHRLAIGAAGMIAELGLACLATFLWSFLPDGPVRGAIFLLATVTWSMTLLVNLNPLMRFDGYYLLSDFLGVENLQHRAFALARWRLRETLFGLGDAPPEALPGRLRRFLVALGVAMHVYRLLLYVGLALLAYHLFFKALGLALLTGALFGFILLPLGRELRAWRDLRGRIRPARAALAGCVVLGLGWLALFHPWQTRLRLPAVMRAERHAVVHAPAAARVESIHVRRGTAVQAGQTLMVLAAPDLDSDIVQARLRIDVGERLVDRQAASRDAADDIAVLRRRLIADRIALEGLLDKKARLSIRAPFDGSLRELALGLQPGRWVAEDEALARLIDTRALEITAFVSEQDLHRIVNGTEARFIPEELSRPGVAATVVDIARVNAQTLDEPTLSSEWGGDIAVRRTPEGRLVPTTGMYRVTLAPSPEAAPPELALRGVVLVHAERMAVARRLWRRALSIMLRESGF